MRAAEPRLDPLEQEAEEQILPALVLAQARPRGGRERRGVLGGGQHIGADITRERFGDGEAFDAGEIRGDAAAGHDRRQDGAQICRGLLDQRVHVGAGSIPFQHGELGRMQIAALAVPPHPRELEDRPRARRPAASSWRTPGWCAATAARACRPGVRVRCGRRADAPLRRGRRRRRASPPRRSRARRRTRASPASAARGDAGTAGARRGFRDARRGGTWGDVIPSPLSSSWPEQAGLDVRAERWCKVPGGWYGQEPQVAVGVPNGSPRNIGIRRPYADARASAPRRSIRSGRADIVRAGQKALRNPSAVWHSHTRDDCRGRSVLQHPGRRGREACRQWQSVKLIRNGHAASRRPALADAPSDCGSPASSSDQSAPRCRATAPG